ncbi:MAG: methylmalonyl Co-A mutase-associated GTPase MeaB [Myxococcota bacterium]|nr:methylmalonyl Co-A mutase-associated GTPase MeaB [Myxococcota bacterium]
MEINPPAWYERPVAESLAARVLGGDRGAVARLIRLVDDRDPAGLAHMPGICRAAAGASIVGVTGPPGSGKSTIVDRLIDAGRARGRRIGVVAVDPSSPFTGGAILGDRIRMQRHAADDDVFIRSLATRGRLGGLSASARDVLAVLAAAGFRTLLLETVGVGQDEIDVTRVADTVLLVVAPGAGDAVQTLKAGVIEIADVFVVNKMDRDGAYETAREMEQMIAFGASRPGGWTPPVVLACAADGRGIDEIVACVDRREEWMRSSGADVRQRTENARFALIDLVRARLDAVLDGPIAAELDAASDRIASGASDPHTEAAGLVDLLARSAATNRP